MSNTPRVLVLSNLYPPFHLGGYELACADVVQALRSRGWDVVVLTSWRGPGGPRIDRGVLRLLRCRLWCDPPFAGLSSELAWAYWNRRVLAAVAARSTARVIHVFNAGGLGAMPLAWLHSQSLATVHDVSDTGLIEIFESDPCSRLARTRPRSALKRLARSAGLKAGRSGVAVPVPMNLGRSYFRSRFLRQLFVDAGLSVGEAPVIYHGVRRAETSKGDRTRQDGIVYAGRLSPEKGIHVLLAGLAHLKRRLQGRAARVTLAGPLIDGNYGRELRTLAGGLLPEIRVEFVGHVPRERVGALLRSHGIFVFPVLWDEPFSIALLEALNAGLAVVATCTGGSGEIIVDGVNCLIVPRDDPAALAEAVFRLLTDDRLRASLGNAAAETASHFDFDTSLESIERQLAWAANA
jgi:glycogen synthase